MQKKWIVFAGAFLCLAAAGWAYYQYQKPRAGVAQLPPAFRITSDELYAAYSTNEAAASKKYDNQVVEVTGPVTMIETKGGASNVLLGAAAGGVNCSMASRLIKKPAQGEQITVKGRCAGFLMDVSLVDAVQINK